uniref:Uncharacterized protein n=1 Tax=Sphaerodactylus townsendi TaxID=933632 RepID=A0ACB8FS89_9SAUR
MANSPFESWKPLRSLRKDEQTEKLSPPTLWPKELSVKEHANVTLNCTTSEHSSVTVSWYKDGKPIPDKAALSERNRTLTIPDISKADAGTYTCEAKNGANNATSNPSKIFVEDGPGPPFPPGAIVGIVIGCLAGVALIVVVLYCTLKNTTLGRMAQLSSNGNIILHPRHWCYRSPAAGSRDSSWEKQHTSDQGVTETKPTVGEEDIQYTTLAFSGGSPTQPGPKPAVPLDSGTIYSVIKNK